jgi:hypothetical protein
MRSYHNHEDGFYITYRAMGRGASSEAASWPVSARFRRGESTAKGLHLGLLGDLECIIDLDTQIPHGAFELGVPEQQLHRPKVLGSSID